jgi:hypothetical protein
VRCVFMFNDSEWDEWDLAVELEELRELVDNL